MGMRIVIKIQLINTNTKNSISLNENLINKCMIGLLWRFGNDCFKDFVEYSRMKTILD